MTADYFHTCFCFWLIRTMESLIWEVVRTKYCFNHSSKTKGRHTMLCLLLKEKKTTFFVWSVTAVSDRCSLNINNIPRLSCSSVPVSFFHSFLSNWLIFFFMIPAGRLKHKGSWHLLLSHHFLFPISMIWFLLSDLTSCSLPSVWLFGVGHLSV